MEQIYIYCNWAAAVYIITAALFIIIIVITCCCLHTHNSSWGSEPNVLPIENPFDYPVFVRINMRLIGNPDNTSEKETLQHSRPCIQSLSQRYILFPMLVQATLA